jgi:hypothetical protein
MQTRSKAFLIALIGLMSAILPVAAVSADSIHNTSSSFQWHIGDSFLAAVNPTFGAPSVTMTYNGDRVSINGTGTLSLDPSSVTGGGKFVHRDSSGNIKAMGTWQADSLISFVSYGPGTPQGLPSNFFGGKAIFQVTLLVGGKPVHDGILTVFCQLGEPPKGVDEGVRLVVQGTPFNFNKQLSGFTVFVEA